MTESKKVIVAEALGFFVLLPACILGAWTGVTVRSSKPWPTGIAATPPYRPKVDEWAWSWLNPWYSNVEDGVSGQQAWVWRTASDGSPFLVPYTSLYPVWVQKYLKGVIAYGWSAWRNGAHAAKIAAGDISANPD